MKIQYIQHVPFEDPAGITIWAEKKGHSMSAIRLYENPSFPDIEEFDWLIVMGGPMNIYEEDKYPWLHEEKLFIKDVIEKGKIVLGICLGAQLIADALGGKVTGNSYKEIGWFPVKLLPEAEKSNIFRGVQSKFIAFHWHGDTFSIPQGCLHIAESEACENQAFEYDGRVLGLQFHLESTKESIGRLIDNCGDEINPGSFIQDEKVIRSEIESNTGTINCLMADILDSMEKIRV